MVLHLCLARCSINILAASGATKRSRYYINLNMQNKPKPAIPLKLIAMDAAGAVLLGVGVAEMFAGTNLMPPAWQFENYALMLIIFGIALMLPMVTYILSGRKDKGAREI